MPCRVPRTRTAVFQTHPGLLQSSGTAAATGLSIGRAFTWKTSVWLLASDAAFIDDGGTPGNVSGGGGTSGGNGKHKHRESISDSRCVGGP